jgi:hypothetical protein
MVRRHTYISEERHAKDSVIVSDESRSDSIGAVCAGIVIHEEDNGIIITTS